LRSTPAPTAPATTANRVFFLTGVDAGRNRPAWGWIFPMLTNCVIPLQLLPSSLAPSGGEVMNTDDEEVNLKAWRQRYEAAVLELDPTKIQDRIEEAEKAIAKRALW